MPLAEVIHTSDKSVVFCAHPAPVSVRIDAEKKRDLREREMEKLHSLLPSLTHSERDKESCEFLRVI